jgi:hypothetical protein
MQLTTGERFALLSILPAEGSLSTIKIVRTLREDLSFSEEEHTVLEFKEVTKEGKKTIEWNLKGESNKDIDIGPRAFMTILDLLKKLDETGKVKEYHLPLFEKFPNEQEKSN